MEAVMRVLQECYDSDEVADYVEEAKEAAFKDEKLRVACILQPSDTCAVRATGAKIKVLEPQGYAGVTTLGRSHLMFTNASLDEEEVCSDANGCAGLFYTCDEGNAVSGSGGDVWYKVGPKLVGLCTRLDAEANALAASLASPDPVADTLHASMEAASREIQDIETEIRRAMLVVDGLVALKDKSVEKTRTLRQRLAKRKLECLSGNAEA